MAFALVPFFRMVKGFSADKLFKASVDCDMVLLKSNMGMNNYELGFCSTIKLLLRRIPTLTVGIPTFIVGTLVLQQFYSAVREW